MSEVYLVVVRTVTCKSIIGKCGIPGIEYSINPYTGCQHCCSYCYARFMLRFHAGKERWGEFVDVKINAPQVLSKQLPKIKRGLVWISSVTDPYQPVEAKYGVTSQVLQRLLSYQFPITVLTKSKLVLRDIEVLRQFKDCEVGVTIVTLDDGVRRRFEPNASTIAERLSVLRTLHEANVNTYAFLGPFLPVLSGETVEELADQLREVGVDRVLVDRLNIKGGNWGAIRETLDTHYPDLIPQFREAVSPGSTYYTEMKKEVTSIFNVRNIAHSFCY